MSGPGELHGHAIGIGPKINQATNELAAVIAVNPLHGSIARVLVLPIVAGRDSWIISLDVDWAMELDSQASDTRYPAIVGCLTNSVAVGCHAFADNFSHVSKCGQTRTFSFLTNRNLPPTHEAVWDATALKAWILYAALHQQEMELVQQGSIVSLMCKKSMKSQLRPDCRYTNSSHFVDLLDPSQSNVAANFYRTLGRGDPEWDLVTIFQRFLA